MSELHSRQQGSLFPMLALAAVAVIVLSAASTAAIVGWLPSEHPFVEQPARPSSSKVAVARCADCGTVTSVQAIQAQGDSSGLGAIAGGVVGGLLGNQVGGGNGRTLATIAGAGGGAYAGNRIEKEMNRTVRYRVTVRTDDGETRSFDEAASRWRAGDRVSLQGGRLSPVPAAR